ncbi:MAG: hypothetical protein EOL90_05515 [Spartobacteria bacterium]|nr:hypothetical protein [Spartobacteria bacterium]
MGARGRAHQHLPGQDAAGVGIALPARFIQHQFRIRTGRLPYVGRFPADVLERPRGRHAARLALAVRRLHADFIRRDFE